MGRNKKLDKTLINEIAENIKKAYPIETACALSGVGKSTYYYWKKLGEESREKSEESIYLEFLDTIDTAEEIAKAKLIDDINVIDSTMVSKRWILERRWPKQFAKIEKLEHSGKDGEPIKFQVEWPDKSVDN